MSAPSKLVSFDTETHLFRPGEMAPPVVCGSSAKLVDGNIVGELLVNGETEKRFEEYLSEEFMVAYANAAYDLAVMANARPELLPKIFKALEDGRVYDVLIAEALNAIYHGHLNVNPANGQGLRSPSTGKVSKRYSLEIVTHLNLGRIDAKTNDVWRKSYALLEGIPLEHWPATAREYPIDDAKNTIEVALKQMETHQNLDNLAAQVEAAFALHLGAAWGLRTDKDRIEKLATEVEGKHKTMVERFQKKGWIRPDGTEDQIAVKRAVALAYGASGKCERCKGNGQIQKEIIKECRGPKIKGRFKGCSVIGCICDGTGKLVTYGKAQTCKASEGGCDGTGFDLLTAPLLKRTDKGGIQADRDAKMESGDDDLYDYGEDEFEKSRSTYIPYLRKGIDKPLTFSANVLVATGRCSYEGSPLHQMPREGAERGCIRARGAWCGSPVEYVFGSTDYEAGELVTFAQYCYWLFGYSQMKDAINAHGKPGVLHSVLAAEVLGIPLEDFLVRLKNKDRQAIAFRTMSKPINFGTNGRMGAAKLVITSRKKNAGFTFSEDGPSRDYDGNPGYWGVRFCILTGGSKRCGERKVIEWNGYACPPVCEACVNVVTNTLRPAYFKRYREVKEYFKWASDLFEDERPAPCLVWDAETQKPRVVRERKCDTIMAFCNNGFQAMLSDVGKLAFVRATREAYLGVAENGEVSPLAGSRLPLYIHDEPFSELILDQAHMAGPRIADLMMAAGYELAPDVAWRAETALCRWWEKKAEPVYIDGRLIPWEPHVG